MPKKFQKLYYKESIQAIKDSLDFLFYENFKNAIELSFPKGSENPEQITSSVLERFFPDKKLDIFMAKVWQAFNDEKLLKDLFRYYFIEVIKS